MHMVGMPCFLQPSYIPPLALQHFTEIAFRLNSVKFYAD